MDTYSVESFMWSTDFVSNYKWIEVKKAVNENGFPNQGKRISSVRGLPW